MGTDGIVLEAGHTAQWGAWAAVGMAATSATALVRRSVPLEPHTNLFWSCVFLVRE